MKIIYNLLAFTLLVPVMLCAGNIEVCLTCDTQTIREGLNNAVEGDTIYVQEGTYEEGNLIVDKSVSIIGKNRPVVDAGDTSEIFVVIAPDVEIRGFQLQNVKTSYLKDRAAIRIRKQKGFKIIDNLLLNKFFAIYLEHASDGIVENNRIIGKAVKESSAGNAIHAWYCSGLTISNNEVEGHRDGIYFEFVDESVIHGNDSHDNLRYGLHFMFSNDDIYTNNIFTGNGAGVAVMFSKRKVSK